MNKIGGFFKFYWVGVLISLIFFIVGIATLSHYGNNIDESMHFEKGNAYLDFFLTGRENYTDADFTSKRTSEWKYRGFDTAYLLKNDCCHPTLNDVLAAATNRILHEKLGIMGDLESYHIFELFVSTMLVFLVFAMVRRKYGIFAGVVASLSIALYPLFYGEARYNIKDPIEASFFAFTLYFFYLGVERAKGRFFFISSLFCALAFGTKFNIVFLPFIIIPYLLFSRGFAFIFQKGIVDKLKRIPKSIYINLLVYPVIVLGINFIVRPWLWQDPINRFLSVIKYYKDIGTGTDYQDIFIQYGWNTYPTFFVGISTPLVILALFLVGVIVALFRIKREKDKFSLLLLLWLGVTILRVSFPGTSIYGGVRQIMEYIPAMAAISGIGALYIRSLLTKFVNVKIASLLILIAFIPLTAKLIQLHPNENLFINSLVGGLKGATDKKIPGVGETMGNAYLQAIWWINEHAEKNASFGIPLGLGSNFPPEFLRKDIKFGPVFSAMRRDGEYMIEMYSVEFPFHRYSIDYLENILDPVYVGLVDGVPILKVWKNDVAHTKPGFAQEGEVSDVAVSGGIKEGFIRLELENPANISRIEIDHNRNSCVDEGTGKVTYSALDGGEVLLPDDLFRSQTLYPLSLQTETHFVYFLTGQKTKKITITPEDKNLCLLQVKSVKIYGLKGHR